MGRTAKLSRQSALVATIVAIFACVAAASASAAPYAFVSNREGNSVSAIDTATNTVVGEAIKVGEGPASIAITPNGRLAYVANAFGSSVSVIETATRRTVGAPIEVGKFPYGLAITPNGKYAYVTDRNGEEVSVINTETQRVVGEIKVGVEPTGVAISPDGKTAYVADFGGEAVELINTETMKVVGSPIKVGEGPMGIGFTPDGKTAYVVDKGSEEVSAINTATRLVSSIPLHGEEPRGIEVTPDGSKAFVVSIGPGADLVSVVNTQTNLVSAEIKVGAAPEEVAITPDGKTVYVTEAGPPSVVQTIDVETGAVVGSSIAVPGEATGGIAITPDQSPTAIFTAPTGLAASPLLFNGAASTDPDGLIASYDWSFGDGTTAAGVAVDHAFAQAGNYSAQLSVIDNEGCGVAEVYTGRTAYCSGNPGASIEQPVTVTKPTVACTSRFQFGGISHNRKNGTARLRVKLPAAGSILLFGKKVHAVTRKAKGKGWMVLTIHARVELNKRLKKVHRASVKVRITFTPTVACGAPTTIHRSLALLHARRRKHHG